MSRGIDCAAPLSAEKALEIKALGYDFAGRYLVPCSGATAWKALTKTEAEGISRAGLGLLTVWETTADRAKSGAAAGAKDGASAARLARELGVPPKGVIYFAVDYDAGSSDFAAIGDYLAAARAQTGEYGIGVYGSFAVVEAMAKLDVCRGFWQCVAWSHGRKSPALTVYQEQWDKTVAGVKVDINLCPDMERAGIWKYQEDDMTGEEIYKALGDYLLGQKVPEWARDELQQAIDLGITDGNNPMGLVPRYQAAIMALRAVKGEK
jgi:hypothetical protein